MNNKARITVRMPNELNIELYNKSQKLGLSKNALILKILWDEVQSNKIKEEENE